MAYGHFFRLSFLSLLSVPIKLNSSSASLGSTFLLRSLARHTPIVIVLDIIEDTHGLILHEHHEPGPMAPKRTALLLLLPLSATLSTLFSRVECKIPPPDTSNQHRAVKAVATVPEIAKSQISGSNPVEDRIGEAEQASISLGMRISGQSNSGIRGC